MITRRLILISGLGSVGLARAADPFEPSPGGKVLVKRVPVDVVKIMGFTCSFCLSAEAQNKAIARAAIESGGRFVRAPIPVTAADTGAREKLYYAARDMDPALGEAVKQSLYRGLQETEVPLNDLLQLYYWLLQDIPEHESKFNLLFERAQGVEAAEALKRAERLVVNSGAQFLPTYVLLTGGKIRAALDTRTSPNPALTSLRDAVISNVESLSKNTP